MREGRSLRMLAGVIFPPTASERRPKITVATRPLSCWETMDLTRVSKSGSRNRIPYSPTRPIIAASTGSDRLRCKMAFFILKQLRAGVRHPYCTGMRKFILFALTVALCAQQQQQQRPVDDAPATIKVDVNVVNILASVRD